MLIVGRFLLWLIQVYLLLLLVRAIMSWMPLIAPNWRPRGVVASFFELIFSATDPPLKLLRRWIKPLRTGNVSLDLAFIVLLVILMVFQRVVVQVFF